jgi:alpha-ribazole phosphatase
MRITLIRHTTLNIEPGVCYGQSDVDVSAQFNAEFTRLLPKLADTQFDAIYTSPLQRCAKLAEALQPNIQINKSVIQLDERLKELHFGDWEMRAWDSIPRDLFNVWAHDYANLAPPNGETFSQLQARAKSFIEAVTSHSHDQHICVVTHGGLIRALIADALELPLKRLFRIQVDYASVTELEFTRPDLTELNANGAVPKVHFINR